MRSRKILTFPKSQRKHWLGIIPRDILLNIYKKKKSVFLFKKCITIIVQKVLLNLNI